MKMDDELQGFKPESLSLYVIIEPVLNEISSGPDAQTLRAALKKAERHNPGLTKDIVMGILKAKGVKVDLTKVLLKLCACESEEYTITRREPQFVRLQDQSQALKMILATLPDVAVDRPRFLQTIKEIASGIKEMLEAVQVLFRHHEAFANPDKRKALDGHKRDFIRSSKGFSDTLKMYFRDGNIQVVYASAIHLVTETNTLLKLLRNL
ncbi:putative programmed cell death protein 10 [Apostichopus japonicus]|uniref:Programmed cell death protein 10 n=1 Tax=Stichopus japonicus TaxID=307972 RepID=A0A0X7YCD7_STIJA|nr:programmed cell death protein 10 [Apostichopus japonicus]PIK59548.1 putative programmed cell death protein 10 [Apostichopus japonicus]